VVCYLARSSVHLHLGTRRRRPIPIPFWRLSRRRFKIVVPGAIRPIVAFRTLSVSWQFVTRHVQPPQLRRFPILRTLSRTQQPISIPIIKPFCGPQFTSNPEQWQGVQQPISQALPPKRCTDCALLGSPTGIDRSFIGWHVAAFARRPATQQQQQQRPSHFGPQQQPPNRVAAACPSVDPSQPDDRQPAAILEPVE
jgi:hypothetical protein